MQSGFLHQMRTEVISDSWTGRIMIAVLCLVIGSIGGVLTAGVSPVAGIGVAMGLLVGLAMLVSTQIGMLGFIAVAYLLPFAVMPVPIGGVKPTFLDATLTVLLAVWLLRLLASPGERLVLTPLDAPVLIFLGLAITSFLFGAYSVSPEVLRFFLKTINSILLYFSVTNCLRTRQQLRQVFLAAMFAALAAALIGVIFYLLPSQTSVRILGMLRPFGYYVGGASLRYIAGTQTLRATGTAVDPNVLGGMLVLGLPLVMGQIFASDRLLRRCYAIPMAGFMLVGLLLTFSRGALVGTVAALLFLGTIRYRWLWAVLALFVVALYVSPPGEIVVGHLESGLRMQDQAAAMRLGEYKDAIRLISQYPWFGVGFGEAPSIDLYVATSSIYLLMAEEMGLIGLGAFLLTLAIFFIHCFRSLGQVKATGLQTIQVGAMASVFGALTAGLVDHYFFNIEFPHTVALFWLFVGLAMVATRLGRQTPTA